MPRHEPQAVRFHKHYIPEPNSGCWLWIGAVIKSGRKGVYGVLGKEREERLAFGGSNDLAHRVSYKLHKGALQDSEEIDHTCVNTYCVNPDHLEIVTREENVRRAYFRRYGNACKKGHPFTPENTWLEKNGMRHCRKCHADHEAKNRAAKIPKQPWKRAAQAHRILER